MTVASEEIYGMNNDSTILVLPNKLVFFFLSFFLPHLLQWQKWGVEYNGGVMGVSISDVYIFQLPSADIKQNTEYMNLTEFKMKCESGRHLDYTR